MTPPADEGPEKKRPKMLGYSVGQVMKQSKGKANPKQVNELLLKKLCPVSLGVVGA